MRINSINNYNTTPLNFAGKDKKNNGMLNAAKAMMLATTMSAVAPSCDNFQDVVHNHFVQLPVDTFTKNELSPTPLPPQVIYVEKEVPGKNDTIIVKVPEYITEHDTFFKIDTFFVPKIIRDTVTLPGETIYVKEDWKSPVPPKQQEIYDRLGIETTGDGKFFLSTNYYDRKNSVLVTRNLNGLSSSRDGKILVYNVIKTGWDHQAEGVTLGKNETFEKHLVYLSEDGNALGIKVMKPKVDIKPADGNGRPNWVVFEKGTLSTPDAWTDESSFFATPEGGIIKLSNGFTLKSGRAPQSVTKTNSYGSEWELSEWNVVKGDPD